VLYFLQLPVKNFLKEKVLLTPSVEMTLGELVEEIRRNNVNFAVFVKDHKPFGIITERDIVRALYQKYPLNEKAFPLAKKELFKIKSSSSLLSAFNLMTENFIRRLIVVDEKGHFEGVLEQQELILYSSEELFRGEGKIRDLVETKGALHYANGEETVEEALAKMAQYNIGALPILDENLRPRGIITEKDLLKLGEEDLKRPLKEVALKEVITIGERDSILKGVELFKKHFIRHLVVVNAEGQAINILSQRDLVQSLTCTYAEFLEYNLKQAKNFISLLPEIVLELSECDSSCKITWMNEFAKKNLGEDYLERDVYTLLDFDDWNRIYGLLKRERMLYKERVKGKGGKVFELTGTYLDFGTKEGKIKIFLRDVTHEYLKEETYQREIRFLRNFLDNSLDFIFVIDEEGKIVYANTSFQKALGYTEEEVTQRTIFDIVDLPEEELRKNIELLIKKGLEIKGRRFYKDIHQHLIPVEIKARAVLLNGHNFIIINARDIRESLETERAFRENLQNLSSFYVFTKALNHAQSEEELFKVLEKSLLEKVETFHYFEINPRFDEIVTTYLAGKKENWEDCLTLDPRECKLYRTGKSFHGSKENPCLFSKRQDLSHLCIPLIFEGRLQRMVTILKSIPFSEEEIKFFEDKVQVFNLYLNQMRLLQEYRDLSTRDPLLGIYNRRFLLEMLKKEEEKAKRLQKPFSLILTDLDHFKKINDTYGHPAGDRVLKAFAELVSGQIRGMDLFARWGGEEFIIFLPEIPKEIAARVAERIRGTLEKYEISLSEEIALKITASFGVASFPEDALSFEGVIKKADERLYRAKETGRNRVIAS